VLVKTRHQHLEVYRRMQEGWMLHIYGSGDEVALTSIDVRLPLAAIYDGADVPEIGEVPTSRI
jgi:Uma2 family endonuclease